MKKFVLITIPIIIILVVSVGLYFGTRTTQDNLTAERTSGLIGNLALHSTPQFVELRPGLVFKIDTGSDFSSITEKDIAFLDSLGFHPRTSSQFILGRNGDGEILLKTKRITFDLPIYRWGSKTDSTGMTIKQCYFNDSNMLRNVDFVPSQLPYSVLGIDFLEKFNIEYRVSDGMVGLYFSTPKGYEECADLSPSKLFTDWITVSTRYYIPVTVDDKTDKYFIDTGVPVSFIKRPKSQLVSDTQGLFADTVVNNHIAYSAIGDPSGWVTIGDREGKALVYYYDSDEESHSINPLNIFDDVDMVLDFPDRKMLFKK